MKNSAFPWIRRQRFFYKLEIRPPLNFRLRIRVRERAKVFFLRLKGWGKGYFMSDLMIGADPADDAVIIAKVEVTTTKSKTGQIKHEAVLTYYAPGEMATGCDVVDCVCESIVQRFGLENIKS